MAHSRRFSDNTVTHTALKQISSIEKKNLLRHASVHVSSNHFRPLEGYLDKKSSKGKWQRRYFEAKDLYLTYRNKQNDKKVSAAIDLRTCGQIYVQNPGSFAVSLDDRKYEMKVPEPWTDDLLLAEEWVHGLKQRQAQANSEILGDGSGDTFQEDTNSENMRGAASKHGNTTQEVDNDSDGDSDGELVHSVGDNKLDDEVDPTKDYHHHHHKAAHKIQAIVRGKNDRQMVQKIKTGQMNTPSKTSSPTKTKTKTTSTNPLNEQLKHMNTKARIDLRTNDKLSHLPANMRTESKADMLHHFYEDKEKSAKAAKRRSISNDNRIAIEKGKQAFEKHGTPKSKVAAVANVSPGDCKHEMEGDNNSNNTGSVVGIPVNGSEEDVNSVKAKQACCCVIS
jgi:hypothetical protein